MQAEKKIVKSSEHDESLKKKKKNASALFEHRSKNEKKKRRSLKLLLVSCRCFFFWGRGYQTDACWVESSFPVRPAAVPDERIKHKMT